MTAWAKRRWPTLIVLVATVYGLVSMVVVYIAPPGVSWVNTPPGKLVLPALLGLFPFGFLAFFISILPYAQGAIFTICLALLTLAVFDEIDRRSRRGGLIALAAYLGLCVYLVLMREEIWLWGTAIRRVCHLCGYPIR